MVFINDIIENKLIIRLILSLIVIFAGIFTYMIFSRFLSSKIEKGDIKILKSKKGKTYIKMLKNISRYILIIIALLIILHIFGIDISSMIAGVGIISIIIGFAIQDALKDIIKGIDIITDNYYNVGDVIKFGDITGKVLNIGLKTTKLQDVASMNIISISNRNIEQVEIVSNLINIDIPIPYEVKVHDAEKAIEDIVSKIKEEKNIDNCEYRGVNDLADSSIKYQIKVYCDPINKVQKRRDALRIILLGLSKHNISVPYNQIDVHQK